MEAPKKIYIQRFNVSEEDAKFKRVDYFDDVWTEEPEPGCENVEYTRTDAFMEKMARFLENKLYDRVEIQVFGTVIPSLTSKKAFIEKFKNYMKGE